MPVFGSKTPIFGQKIAIFRFLMVIFTFSESNHVPIDKLVKALENQREKLRKKLKNLNSFFFPKMAACPHLLTLWFTPEFQDTVGTHTCNFLNLQFFKSPIHRLIIFFKFSFFSLFLETRKNESTNFSSVYVRIDCIWTGLWNIQIRFAEVETCIGFYLADGEYM